MYIRINSQSQLALLRNVNPYLGKYKIPREVLHEIGRIIEFEHSMKSDSIALFLQPLKNDTIDILDELHLYPKDTNAR